MNDDDHPWLIAVQRQKRWMWISMAFSMVVSLAVMVFVVRMISTAPPSGMITWAVFGFVVMFGLPIALVSIQLKKQRCWAQQMLNSAGMLCPQCKVLIDVRADQGAAECAKCGRVYTAEELRQFWGMLVQDPMRAGRWWVVHYGGKGVRGRAARWFMPEGRPRPMRLVIVQVAIWTTAGILFAAVVGGSLVAGALQFAHIFLFMTGFMLIVAGRKMRVGDSRHCAKCDYEQGPSPAPPAPPALERCPECGFNWNAFAGTVRGRWQKNGLIILTGVAMMALGVAAIFKPFTGSNWQLKVLPTGSLITETVSQRGFTMNQWMELRSRTLSPDQSRQLAIGLLDKRRKRTPAWLTADEDNWFFAQITAGTLPDDLKQRYYREMLDIELNAPAYAKVGEPVALSLRCTARGASTNNPFITAFIGGYFIDDDPHPIGRQSNGIAGIMLDPLTAGRTVVSTEATFTTHAPGTVEVQATVWVIGVPMGGAHQVIQWQADGTPVIPANAVWHELRELEQTIDIVE